MKKLYELYKIHKFFLRSSVLIEAPNSFERLYKDRHNTVNYNHSNSSHDNKSSHKNFNNQNLNTIQIRKPEIQINRIFPKFPNESSSQRRISIETVRLSLYNDHKGAVVSSIIRMHLLRIRGDRTETSFIVAPTPAST